MVVVITPDLSPMINKFSDRKELVAVLTISNFLPLKDDSSNFSPSIVLMVKSCTECWDIDVKFRINIDNIKDSVFIIKFLFNFNVNILNKMN